MIEQAVISCTFLQSNSIIILVYNKTNGLLVHINNIKLPGMVESTGHNYQYSLMTNTQQDMYTEQVAL